jgi:hypothetical protein
MSNKRITDLTELTTPTTDDVLPIVDIASNTTQKVQVGNLPTTTAVTNALATKQETLVSGTNIKTINSTSLLGSGDIAISATPSGVSGAIQFSNGSAFASDAANLFWDDTNNRLGVGTNTPTATTHIVGTGSTLSTFSLLVRNSINQGSLSVADDGVVLIGDTSAQGYQARLTFVRASGAGRSASFNQNSTDLIFTNPNGGFFVNGCLTTLKGSGSTSATTSLLVQNSAGLNLFSVRDDGQAQLGTDSDMRVTSGQQVVVRFNMAVGTLSAPVASARLQVDSTAQGFLPPRMTTTQKNAIASPASGLILYDSTTNKLQCYNGSTWNDLF